MVQVSSSKESIYGKRTDEEIKEIKMLAKSALEKIEGDEEKKRND